jgi:hypothetical protein
MDRHEEEDESEDRIAARFAEKWHEMEAVERYLEYVRGGYGELNAGIAVGWSPAETKKRLRVPSFRQLVSEVQESRIETVEQRVYEEASKKRPARWAVEFVLLSHARDRGWAPATQKIEVNRNVVVDVSLRAAVVEAAKELMTAADPAALQPGGALDVIDTTATDAD